MPKVPVTVYSTPNCVQCMMTKKQLEKLGIEYSEVDLTEHPDKLAEFKEQGYASAPIVTTDNKIWAGFRLDKIKGLAHYLFGESRHG